MARSAKRLKSLWCGVFNYRLEVCIEYAYAYSKRQAWFIMCRRLAERHDVHPSVVMDLFDGSRDNYTIELEMEFNEVSA